MPGSPLFPDAQALTAGLTAVLAGERTAAGPVTILAREPNPYASTFASEVVTCRLPDRSERQLFCKYGAGPGSDAYGHRGGVRYEAKVYHLLLGPLRADVPALHGVYAEDKMGQTWIICDYLSDSDLLHREPAALALAARWIASFHHQSAARLRQASLSFLNTYTREYYLGWARRTSSFAEGLHGRFPWLRRLCERFEEAAGLLLTPPMPVIHGEFYPGNILVQKGRIYPVDWESAAVAAGEIDLASLTEGWSENVKRTCEAEYERARWPEGPPLDFDRRLAAARLYLAFRWLGERPEWTTDESLSWRFEQLHSAGKGFGLL